MKLTLLPWAVAPALVAPLLLPGTTSQATPLVRVQSPNSALTNAPDLSAWKDRLTTPDLDRREQAFDEFVATMRRDPALHQAAQDWCPSDPDLAWTTRLALREARDVRGSLMPRSPLSRQGFAPNDLRSRLDDMQRQFGDLDRMFEDFERRLNHSPGGVGQNPHPFQPNRLTEEHQSHSLQITPDGVKVEVEENVGGKREKKTYEAKTLDELYDAHPELQNKIGGRVQILPGPRAWQRAPDEDDARGGFAVPAPGGELRSITPFPLSGELRTDRLGVGVGDMTADDRKAAQVDEDVGLKVASVEPNSIASKIGIELGDVVVEVNGRTVRGAPDVLEVLAQRKSDQDVVVKLVDSDGKKRTLTWRAPAPSADRSGDRRKL